VKPQPTQLLQSGEALEADDDTRESGHHRDDADGSADHRERTATEGHFGE
jgi:hypothetical protein